MALNLGRAADQAGTKRSQSSNIQAERSTTSLSFLAKLYAPAAALLAAALLQPFAPAWLMFVDPVATLGGELHVGAITYLGVLIWWGGAAISAFAGAAAFVAGARRRGVFLVAFATLTAMLALDDLYMIHEVVAPHFGVGETTTMAAYGVTLLVLLAAFRSEILRRRPILLGVALVLFAVSAGADMLPPSPVVGLTEESAKFLAIVGWTGYFIHASWASIRDDIQP